MTQSASNETSQDSCPDTAVLPGPIAIEAAQPRSEEGIGESSTDAQISEPKPEETPEPVPVLSPKEELVSEQKESSPRPSHRRYTDIRGRSANIRRKPDSIPVRTTEELQLPESVVSNLEGSPKAVVVPATEQTEGTEFIAQSPEETKACEVVRPKQEEIRQVADETTELSQPEPEPVLGTKSETLQEPESPPLLPKGSYNIDFDSIDLESFNPFGTKSKVGTVTALPGSGTQTPAKKVSPKEASPNKLTPKNSFPKKASPKKPSPKEGKQ